MTIQTEVLASTNPRFPLAGSTPVPSGADSPSPIGLRPWGLRRARPAGPGRVLPPWSYDHHRQQAVDAAGRPLIDTVWGDPSASTTAATDGEDGPSSEDWNND
jgi:putative ATP-grasp target RiPP